MLSLALNNDDGLVVDDYYKRGMEINRVLDRDRYAHELGVRAQYQLQPGSVEIRLLGIPAPSLPSSLQVELLNATRQGLDRRFLVKHLTDGLYSGDLEDLPPGRWYITLGTNEWRLTGFLQLPREGGGIGQSHRPGQALRECPPQSVTDIPGLVQPAARRSAATSPAMPKRRSGSSKTRSNTIKPTRSGTSFPSSSGSSLSIPRAYASSTIPPS